MIFTDKKCYELRDLLADFMNSTDITPKHPDWKIYCEMNRVIREYQDLQRVIEKLDK